VENYETYYDIPYPDRERSAGRPLRVSPAYGSHVALGAFFGEKAGWERVEYYASNATAGSSLRPRGWAGRGWSSAVGAEHAATRTSAGLFDESSFAKIEVTGPGAARLLGWLCDNEVARDVGAVTYTQCLNARGGIECDFTVTRTAEDTFMVVTGTAFGTRDLAWIRRHAPRDGTVRVADVTGQYACFALWGPRSRGLLGPLTPSELDFPYLTSREITVGDVPVRALRVTFAGELGWELYSSSEYGAALWRTLAATGAVPGGYRAIDGLRLEKGYRVWGTDLSPDVNPYEAGLGFCVRLGRRLPGRGGPRGGEGARAHPAAALPDPGRPARGVPGQRAGPRGREGRRPGDLGRVRPHGRPLDRLRLPARGRRRARHESRGGDLRRVDPRRDRTRAAVRSAQRTRAGLTTHSSNPSMVLNQTIEPSPRKGASWRTEVCSLWSSYRSRWRRDGSTRS
jgi:4-methylaminobutanoate oxidase (formaldehyde-forming)